MIMIALVLLPFLIVVLWAFFRYSPGGMFSRLVLVYNAATLLLAVMISAAYTWKIHTTLTGTGDRAWWPVLSLFAFVSISTLVIGVSGLVRNLVLFRR